jgi:hypothetical protein
MTFLLFIGIGKAYECSIKIVLLRVGIDTGCGGIHSPLLNKDGKFEFLPIPDKWFNVETRTYGNTKGRWGRFLEEYFPERRQAKAHRQAMHVDPEFKTYTYGDPTAPKRGLTKLQPGDLLVFYAGLEGWGFDCAPALYLVGCFRVKLAWVARDFSNENLRREFSKNFHVRHKKILKKDKKCLMLIKGDSKGSRLFRKAYLLGKRVRRKNGSYWQMITPEMEKVFGKFGGIGSLQRSTPCWVEDRLLANAEKFVEGLK